MMLIQSCQDLGALIQQARKSQNFTQKQLAALCGVGERFIIDLEKGKSTCAIDKALGIAKMLGIKLTATFK
ncbi:MAG: helix-turn-helix domain-containing protein [Pseudomonadota bacterium]